MPGNPVGNGASNEPVTESRPYTPKPPPPMSSRLNSPAMSRRALPAIDTAPADRVPRQGRGGRHPAESCHPGQPRRKHRSAPAPADVAACG